MATKRPYDERIAELQKKQAQFKAQEKALKKGSRRNRERNVQEDS